MLKGLSSLARTSYKVGGPVMDITTFNEKCMTSSARTAFLKVENASSQARPDKADSSSEHINYQVLKRLGYNNLHLNLETVPASLQSHFVECYMRELEKEIQERGINVIQFNNVNEEVFRYKLNMPIRKLGYSSYFSRYNRDKGLAVFEKRII